MANKYIVDLTLQRHLSALPKFVPVKSRVCGRQQSGAVVFYALVTLCAKKHVHISVAVGLTCRSWAHCLSPHPLWRCRGTWTSALLSSIWVHPYQTSWDRVGT